jgi:hypothetical protein
MARPLSEMQTRSSATADVGRDLGVTRRTSRSFAAAVAVLMLATIVVNRSSSALTGESANAASVVNSGTIELSDDDLGRSLFQLEDLTPVRPAVRCIEITYGGTILPVALNVRADVQGTLSEYLDITVDEGSGGRYESCEGFVATDTVFEGPLDDFAAQGWLPIGNIVNSGERRAFRITLQLADEQEALGRTTSLAFSWEVVPS